MLFFPSALFFIVCEIISIHAVKLPYPLGHKVYGGRYERVKTLLSGHHFKASIYKVYDRVSKTHKVAKVLDISKEKLARREFEMSQRAGANEHCLKSEAIFTQGKSVIQIMPLTKGALSDVFEGKPLSIEEIRNVLSQVISCLKYMHSIRISHGDADTRNVFVKSVDPLEIVVGDFDLSEEFWDAHDQVPDAHMIYDIRIIGQLARYLFTGMQFDRELVENIHGIAPISPNKGEDYKLLISFFQTTSKAQSWEDIENHPFLTNKDNI